MIQRAIPILSLLALGTVALAQDATQPGQSLTVSANKGFSVWLVEQTKQTQKIDAGGQQIETSNTVARTFRAEVLEVTDDGQRSVHIEVVRVKGSLSIPMLGDFEFDSVKPKDAAEEDDMMGMGADQMIKRLSSGAGSKFVVSIGKDGAVTGSLDAIVKELKENHPDADWNQGSIENLVGVTFGRRPAGPITIGGKWKFESGTSGGIPILQKSEATLTKVDADVFEADITGTMEKNQKAVAEANEEAIEMARSMTITNGKLSGQQRISRQDGFLLSSQRKATADIAMETPMGEMSMAVTVETSVKRTTKEAAMPKPAKKDAGDKKDG